MTTQHKSEDSLSQSPIIDNDDATETLDPDELGRLEGYPGYLTEAETAALDQFRKRLRDAKLYTPASSESHKPSHTDTTLLRFLRARRFDVAKAQVQFTETEKWRKKFNVDELYRTFPVDEYEDAKKHYPTWTGRRDNEGHPLYLYRLADLDSAARKEIYAVPVERRYQRIISLYEYMMNGILNLSVALAKDVSLEDNAKIGVKQPFAPNQISAVSTIVDLGGVSLTQLWGIRHHLQQASTLATANYPETLGALFIVNAPAFFPTVWGWVKGWFDQRTRSKITILGNPVKDPAAFSVLTRFIDRQNLPKIYGGGLEWETGQPPNMDEPARRWLKEVMGVETIRGYIFVDPDAKSERTASKAPTVADTTNSLGDSGLGAAPVVASLGPVETQ